MPGVLLAVRRVGDAARPLHGRPREAALELLTGTLMRDDRAARSPDRDGHPVRRGGRGRRGGGAEARPLPARARLARAGRRRLRPARRRPSTTTSTSALLRAVVDEVGDEAPIVCGTGTNDTRHSIELTKAAAEAGAEAALVVTPYYNKPNPAGIRAHFEAIAAAVPDLPLIAYNIPSRVIVNVLAGRTRRAGEDRQRGRRSSRPTTTSSARSTGMAVLAGNDDIFLRTLELGARRRHPRRLAPGRPADARDLGRGRGRRPRARARDRRRPAPALRGAGA